ncbi:MMPL family transporter, partial [Streptomyces sp. NPDC059956]|uniref:MMPL family transporter n=1 Tax=Streptomyces sp. NPDC059956 TaxID=3347015 RepID=UPI003657734C
MSALARWCLRHRLVAVLLWLLAFGGTAAAAVGAGTAFSNDYEVPGTESAKAHALLREGFHGQGGDTDTIVWRAPDGQSVRTPAVQERMTRALDSIAGLPGVGSVAGPYGPGPDSGARISRDGRTAYAVVTFDRPADSVPKGEAKAVVDAARNPATQAGGLQVELGGRAIGLTEAPSAHLAEVIGVAIAALVLFLAC